MDKTQKTQKRTRKHTNRVDIQVSVLSCLLVVCACTCIFIFNYVITYHSMIDSLTKRSEAVYRYLDGSVGKETFDALNEEKDMETEIYQEVQGRMQTIRETSSIRYLYTAKRTLDGTYIYIVDGLNKDCPDFRNPGDKIEAENLRDIKRAYEGKVVLPKQILKTSWGKIFLAYYPIHEYADGTGNVIGVVGMEFDAEAQYDTYRNLVIITPIVIFLICILAFFVSAKRFCRISNPRSQDLYNTDQLTKLKSRNAFEYDMQNFHALGKQKNLGMFIMDIDYLKRVNDTCGHAVGDKYIQSTARAVAEVLGENMWAYRIGGDEFAVMMSDASMDKMEDWLGKFKKNFRKCAGAIVSEAEVSVGRAIYNEKQDETIYDTYKRADEAMYINKHTKRRSV